MQTNHAADYAHQLLVSLGEKRGVNNLAEHPALSYKRSGLLQITGLMLPIPLASHVDGALMALKALSKASDNLPDYGSQLLGERARLRKIFRKGRHCASGYGRLLDACDGRIALNLVREDDWGLIPAWLENQADNWKDIETCALTKSADYLVNRAAEMGLAAAKDEPISKPDHWFSKSSFRQSAYSDPPLIVDLSSLWAGPLASSLLAMTGAKVIKVESPMRPDGLREGHKRFYDLLNAGKNCVALNFHNDDDLKHLRALLEKADIVIEASRPRALRQLGIIGEDFVGRKAGKIWARLTAYGRDQNRVGFGDDIGISVGLASVMEQAHNEPCFVGDAIADPVNGVHMALAIQASLSQGGGTVLDFSMRDVLRYAMGNVPSDVRQTANEWQAVADNDKADFYPMRHANGRVKEIGADNAVWL